MSTNEGTCERARSPKRARGDDDGDSDVGPPRGRATGGPACVRPLHRSIARAERYWIGRRGEGTGREEGESLVAEEGGGGVSGAFSAVPVIDVFVARWSIFVSLFLCSFLPFPRSDRGRPTLLHPRCVENCPDEECAAALTVRFGGFDSRIHFKKIESRNF